MKLRALLVLALVLGCRGRPAAQPAATGERADLGLRDPKDSADSVLKTPRVISGPSVVVFWLAEADTLNPEDAAAAYDELSAATEGVLDALTAFDIKLLPTNSETVYVALPNHKRRPILVSGLDYPFGYVLIEPGSPERLLTGVYAEDELMDELRAYFDLPEDTTRAKPKVTT
ncbi:MAG: hypothetical protein DMD37_14275 [Gemmatimonadetes bacterium]|nr:MAG: hypothetical protein DMD37_14275 [Gemmatimonadota bacterium]